MAYQPNLISDFVDRTNDGMLTNIGAGINQVGTRMQAEAAAAEKSAKYQGLLSTAIRPEDGKFNPTGWMDAINAAPDADKEKVIQMYDIANAQEKNRLKTIADGTAALNTDRWEAARIDINEDVFDPDAIDEFLAAGLELGIFDETKKIVDAMTTAEQNEQLTQNAQFLGPGYAGNAEAMIEAMERVATAKDNDKDYQEAKTIREHINDIRDGKIKDVIAEIQVTSSMLPGGTDLVKSMLAMSEDGRKDVELTWAEEEAIRKTEKFEQETQTWERGMVYARNADTRAETATRLNALKYQLDEKKYDLDTESVALDARRVRVAENKYLTDLEKDNKYYIIDQQKQAISERLATVTEAQLKLQQEAGVRAQIATEINMTKAVMSTKFQNSEDKVKFAKDIEGLGLETAELLGQLIGVKEPGGEWTGEQKYAGETGLRKEYDAYTSDYNTVILNATNMETMLNDPSGAVDYAVIRLFNKALDPGSVVRQSEADATSGADAMLNRLFTRLRNVSEGELLSPDLREDILKATSILRTASEAQITKEGERISNVASAYGFAPENIFPEGEGSRADTTNPYVAVPVEVPSSTGSNETLDLGLGG